VGLSPASVRRYHSILSAALGRAVKWDWIASNPADKASTPGTTRCRDIAVDDAVIGLLHGFLSRLGKLLSSQR
jgi:hypothetical protein